LFDPGASLLLSREAHVPDSFAIPNRQGELPAGLHLAADRLISVFQNPSGDQSIFSADRTSGEVQLCVVDDHGEWSLATIDQADLDGPFTLNAEEQSWLVACWAAFLGKSIIDVARMYLAARQDRTLMVSLGMPADVHESLF
jgi:hypothetical protein